MQVVFKTLKFKRKYNDEFYIFRWIEVIRSATQQSHMPTSMNGKEEY